MDNLAMMQEYVLNVQDAIDGIVDREYESIEPNRELIEFLTVQSMAFGQMQAFCEWLELKENAPETGISHGAKQIIASKL